MSLFGFRGERGKKNQRRSATRRKPLSARGLHFEPLEQRHLLSVTLNPIIGPETGSAFNDPAGKDLYVPLTGTDLGQTISYSATSTDPNVHVSVLTGNPTMSISVSGTTGASNTPFSGTMTLQLFHNLAPNTVSTIENLIANHIYDSATFYRILPGFVIQGGLGNGTPAPKFNDEINQALSFNSPGILAMANAGPNTNTSEIFITDIGLTTANDPNYLNYGYTAFGQLTSGFDIYNDIKNSSGAPTFTSVTVGTDTQNGVLQISAPNNFTGSATINVTATGSDTSTALQSFTVNVAPPTPTSGLPVYLFPVSNQTTSVNTPIDVPLSDFVTSNVTNANLSFSVTAANGFTGTPANVTVQLTGTGTSRIATLTPAPGFTGTISLLAHVDGPASLNGQAGFTLHDALPFTLTVPGPMTVTAPSGQQVVKVGGTLGISGASISDPGLPAADNVTVVFTATHGTVSLSTGVTDGITSGQVTTNNSASVSVTAPLAAINATLAATSGLSYTPASGFHGSDTLGISANDGTVGNTGTGNATITVAGPITITPPAAPPAVKANGTLAVSGFVITDPSLPAADNVTVVFTATHGTVTLSTAVAGGIASGQVTTNNSASVSVTAPLAAIIATLADANGLKYTPATDFSGSDTLGLAASDTLGNSNPGSVAITVAGPMSVTSPAGQQVVKVNGTMAVGGFVVVDPSLPAADNVTVVFTATHGTVSLSTGVNGGITSGQVTTNNSASVSVTAPLLAINATLAATSGLSYTPASDFNGSDTLGVSANDGTVGNSGTGSATITIAGPITVIPPLTPPAVKAGGTFVVSGLSIADPSLPTADDVTVIFTATHGTISLSTSVAGGITSAQSNGTASVTVIAPLAAINATLADASGLSYTANGGFNGSDTLGLEVSDTLGNIKPGSVAITVAGPITITPPLAALTVKANGTLAVSGFVIVDPSLPAADNVTVVFTANHGTVTLSTTVAGGITSAQTNGTASVTVTAPLAAIIATLADANGLKYTPATDFSGSDTLGLAASDTLGNSTPGSAVITVAPPISITAPGQQFVPTNGTLPISGVVIVDPSLPAADNVTVVFTASHGTVTLLTNVPVGVTNGQVTANNSASVSVTAPLAAINATLAATGGLTYTPTTGYNGPDALGLATSDTLGNSKAGSVPIAVGLTVATPPAQIVKSGGTLAVSGFSISDPAASTTDTLTVVFTATHGTITLSTTVAGGITSAQTNGTASVTVTATLAQINATLADAGGLKYTPTTDFNGADTLSAAATDTHSNSNAGSAAITVAGPMSVTSPAGQQVVKVNGTLAVNGFVVLDPSLPAADNVTVVFTATHGTVSLSTGVTGGVTSGQVTTNNSASVSVTAPLAAINATLAATSGLSYTPASGFHGSDALGVSANDGTVGNSGTGSAAITVAGPITITAPSTPPAVKAGGTLVVGGFSIADPSLPATDNVTVVFTATHGTITLSTTVANGITSAQSNGTNSVTVTAPLAAINATLAGASGLTYAPASGFNGTDTLTLSASDTLGNSNPGSTPITVAGPIAITPPSASQAVKVNGTVGVSGFSITDPSLPSTGNASKVTVVFSAAHGTVTLSTTVNGGITSALTNGTASVTVTDTVAAINATLAATNGLTYAPASGFNGSDTLGLAANDTLGNSNTGSATVVVAGPISILVPSGTPSVKAGGTLGITGVSLTDPSLPSGDNITMTFGVTNGTVSLSTSVAGGITSAQGNGTASVTVTASLAAINATLAAANGLTYTPTVAFHGASTLSLSATDPLGNNGTGNVNLVTFGPLTITTPSGQQAVTSNSTFAVGGISLSDPTNATVTATFAVAHGTISFATAVGSGITSAQVTGNGTASVSITAPVSAINATLAATNGLTYTPTSGFTGSDTLSLAASDTVGNNASGSVSLNVTPGSTATLSGTVYEDSNRDGAFDGAEVGLSGVIVALTGTDVQGHVFTPLIVSTASNGSFKFTNLPQGTYTITKTQPVDLIDGKATIGSLQGTAQGDDVVSGISVGAGGNGTGYNFSEDGLPSRLISINLFLNSTPPFQQVLQNYIAQSYANTSVPTNVPVGVASPVVAPTITVPSTAPALNQGATLAVTGISVADSSLLAASSNVQVTFAVTSGTLNLSTAVSGGVSSGQVSGNASGSVTVTAPLSAINATLSAANGLTFTPSTGATGSVTLNITANDLGNNSSGAAKTSSQSESITVVGAPAITASSTTFAVKQAGTLPVTGISVADNFLLATANNVQVTLTAAHGTITLATSVNGGITSSQVNGNGSGTVTITAPLSAINATLAATGGLTYTPTSGFNGADTLAVSATDQGHTASGTAQSASQNLSITVAGPLAITAPTATQTVAAGGTLAVSGISLADPSLPATTNVTLTLTATHGTVTLSTTVSGGITSAQGNGTASVTVTAPLAAINLTLAAASGLTYKPTSGFNGSDSLALSGSDPLGNNKTASVSITVGSV